MTAVCNRHHQQGTSQQSPAASDAQQLWGGASCLSDDFHRESRGYPMAQSSIQSCGSQSLWSSPCILSEPLTRQRSMSPPRPASRTAGAIPVGSWCSPIGRTLTIPRESSFGGWTASGGSCMGSARSFSSNDAATLPCVDLPAFDPWSSGNGLGNELREQWLSSSVSGSSWGLSAEAGERRTSEGELELAGPELWSWVNSLLSPKSEKECATYYEADEEFSFPVLGVETAAVNPLPMPMPKPMRREASFQLWHGLEMANDIEEIQAENGAGNSDDFSFPLSQ